MIYTGYIYCISSTVTPKRYIGQTTRSISIRWKQHKESARNLKKASAIHFAMNKYGVDNFYIEELEKVSASTKVDLLNKLNDLEVQYIKDYNTLLPNGYNITAGGNNTDIRYHIAVDQYTKDGSFVREFKSISDALKSLNLVGDRGETNIKRCCDGIQCTAYGYTWRYHGCDFGQKRTTRNSVVSVDAYTKDGELIGSFDSISNAIKELNLPKSQRSNISYCCSGKTSICCNLVWRYAGDPFDKYPIGTRRYNQKVVCCTMDNEFVRCFDNLQSASDWIVETKSIVNSNNVRFAINNAVLHRSKSSYGYKWYYSDDTQCPNITK